MNSNKIDPSFTKNFKDWSILKPKLDIKNHKPPLFKEKDFTRTVIIYTKLSKYTFLGIPTTTQLDDSNGKERDGSWGKAQQIFLLSIRNLSLSSFHLYFDLFALPKNQRV